MNANWIPIPDMDGNPLFKLFTSKVRPAYIELKIIQPKKKPK